MGAGLSRLARRHEVVALQVSDPREDELPDVGSIYVEDAETGEQIFVDTSDPGFRSRLRAAADERQAAPRGGNPFGRRRPAPDPDRRGPRAVPLSASPPYAGAGGDDLAWPWALLGLLALPLVVVAYRRLLRQQAERRADLARQGLVVPTPRRDRWRHVAPVLLVAALAVMLLALSRPVAAVAEPRREGTVILAFDVSTSMAAKDMQPTRLDAAKAAAKGSSRSSRRR